MKTRDRIIKLTEIYRFSSAQSLSEHFVLTKIAVIRQKIDGYYVESESGKNLGGPYKTRERAKKRLDEIEMFKHMKRKKASLSKMAQEENSYSSIMRKLRKEEDKELVRNFQIEFKKSFDAAYCQNLEPAEQIALMAAIKVIE